MLLSASDDPAILRERVIKYQRITAKLKEMVSTRESEVKARTAELALLKPFAEQLSTSLLGGAVEDAPHFQVSAKVVIGSVDGQWTPWVCLTGSEQPQQQERPRSEWHPVDTVTARFPELAGRLQSLEPHLSPQDGAGLRARIAALQEELRRLRVRSEALARQKDKELVDARDMLVQVMVALA